MLEEALPLMAGVAVATPTLPVPVATPTFWWGSRPTNVLQGRGCLE